MFKILYVVCLFLILLGSAYLVEFLLPDKSNPAPKKKYRLKDGGDS
jgi:hypothetical protein